MKQVLIVALSALVLTGYTAHGQKNKTGRKLVWSDEFNGTGMPDPAKWGFEEGMPRGVQRQYYTANRQENAKVENGYLVITARKEDFANPKYKLQAAKGTAAYPEAYRKMGADSVPAHIRLKYDPVIHYTSASVTTKGKASWKYGRIEIKAKLPAGKGSSCAVWMLSENAAVPWPQSGEIDIVEALGRAPGHVSSAVHYAGAQKEHLQDNKHLDVPGSNTGFHVYAIEWNADRIDFYCDDNKYHSFELNKTNPPDCFQQPFYLIMNIALGSGDWSGPVDDKALPQQMMIDYVRVYQ